MARLVKGDVVIVAFPYSNATNAKLRPALVVPTLSGTDVIVCMITSQATTDSEAISLITPTDFQAGQITKNSMIRPSRLFTADSSNVRWAGRVTTSKILQVTQALVQIMTR